VRPTAIALTLLVLTAACETSTDPGLFGIGAGGGGSPVTAAEVTGDWSFAVRRTTVVCTAGSLADGTAITAHLDFRADGTVNGTTSTWQTSSATVVFPVTGGVTLTTGAISLILSGGNGTQTGMELRGSVNASGSFTGTLQDPASGLFPMFSGQECDYSASGTKA